MNPVLILSYNGLPLLKQCVESVKKQTIPTSVVMLDNGSTDGSVKWILDDKQELIFLVPFLAAKNIGVSAGWNRGLRIIFNQWKCDHALVLNQDVNLPMFFYNRLLSLGKDFVTGYPVETKEEFLATDNVWIDKHPCFSAFLITRKCWETVGEFWEPDENGVGLFSWCNDCDYHVRAHRLGVKMYKAGVPFFHVGSSVMKNASPKEKRELELQADADRLTFFERYGCFPGTPEYAKLFE